MFKWRCLPRQLPFLLVQSSFKSSLMVKRIVFKNEIEKMGNIEVFSLSIYIGGYKGQPVIVPTLTYTGGGALTKPRSIPDTCTPFNAPVP